jgi:hypothetical protein
MTQACPTGWQVQDAPDLAIVRHGQGHAMLSTPGIASIDLNPVKSALPASLRWSSTRSSSVADRDDGMTAEQLTILDVLTRLQRQ